MWGQLSGNISTSGESELPPNTPRDSDIEDSVSQGKYDVYTSTYLQCIHLPIYSLYIYLSTVYTSTYLQSICLSFSPVFARQSYSLCGS